MSEKFWWYISVLICLICTGIMMLLIIWDLPDELLQGRLVDESAVEEVLQNYALSNGDDVYRVPTGVFIQSFEFANANDIKVTGYIWQKYSNNIPDDISRGFVLPEQVNSSHTVIAEAYRQPYDQDGEQGGELIGWYFDVTLRQIFNYEKYPLDTQEVWIRIWPQDIDRQVILTPDLDSYISTEAGALFGLAPQIVPRGWRAIETYFQYRIEAYYTNFGIDGLKQEGLPVLHYNALITREFTSPFIINIVPLTVMFALLYSILMTTTSSKAKGRVFGFNTSGAIAIVSALFFTAILSHIQLREQFVGSDIVYLESFYFVMYFAILLVSVNVYTFALSASEQRASPFHHNDNFIAKVAFWPIIFIILTVITYFHFDLF